jgi:hypothetical protein
MSMPISASAVISAVGSNDFLRIRGLRLTRGSLNIVSAFLIKIDRGGMGQLQLMAIAAATIEVYIVSQESAVNQDSSSQGA